MVAIYGDSSADQTTKYRHLLDKAKTDGSIRVIIGLNMPEYKLEGELSGEVTIKMQRDKIRLLQDTLLAKINKNKVSGIIKYATSPFLAMKIDLGGLRILACEPLVKSIEEDITAEIMH